jgi:hypothetical protein
MCFLKPVLIRSLKFIELKTEGLKIHFVFQRSNQDPFKVEHPVPPDDDLRHDRQTFAGNPRQNRRFCS